MESWFSDGASLVREILWGIPLWRFIAAVFIVFFGFLSRRLIVFLFNNVLKKRADRTRIRWDDDALEHVPHDLVEHQEYRRPVSFGEVESVYREVERFLTTVGG